IRILDWGGNFNFAAMNNLAAREARGDYLLLLNNDTAVLGDDWLDVLMSHAQRPEIGIAGARLLTPDSQRVQHAGLILGMQGIAASAFADSQPTGYAGALLRAVVEQNYSAV
ncbi:MAG: glycosyltransferase, partial [Rhodospirillaceae bacterium]|nr:glycosyltransferase [Rhodospirillaceae bacterium]